MEVNIVLSLLFAVLLYVHYKRVRRFDVSFVVISLYMLVAVAGAFLINIESRFNTLSLWPYLYLFIIFFFLIQPISKTSYIEVDNVDNRALKLINKLVLLYILCALIVVNNSWTDMIKTIILGEWNTVKSDAYEVGGDSSALIGYAGAFGLYFRFFIFPYCFYLFTQEKIKFWKPLLLLLLCVVATMFHYLASAYRGGMFSILIMLLISFILFKSNLPQKRKKFVSLSGIVMSIVVLAITMSITNSRFENTSNGPWNSLLSYLGQSMVNFNGGIATKATSYMGGDYFFMSARGLEKSSFWIDSKYGIDTNDGSDFDTIIGCFYIDFGPIMAFIIFVVAAYLMKRLLDFRKRFWSSIYLLFFYLELLTAGVFHGPSSLYQQVFNVIVIYAVLLIIENQYGKNINGKSYSLLPQKE